MVRKYINSLTVAFIALFFLFGTGGQAFAAVTGGPSLSTRFYIENTEYLNFGSITNGNTNATYWSTVDSYIGSTYSANYDYYHIFVRRLTYDSSGNLTGGADTHYFVRVNVNYAATYYREDGRVWFKKADGITKVPYEYLRNSNNPISPSWSTLDPSYGEGIALYQQADVADITVFEKFTMSTVYDPANPPGYAYPDNNSPDDGAGYVNPTDPNADPDFPVQPTPPDSNWDLIGWIKYLVDWLIYLVKCFVYFLKSFGTAIADVVNGSTSMISAMTDFFAFLPNQVTTIIGMGLVAMIIVGIVKR